MAYFTCTCGECRHIHSIYMPGPNEEIPIVCVNCGKEWTVTMSRNGDIDATPKHVEKKIVAVQNENRPIVDPGDLAAAALDIED